MINKECKSTSGHSNLAMINRIASKGIKLLKQDNK
jgi:hypothetical protein